MAGVQLREASWLALTQPSMQPRMFTPPYLRCATPSTAFILAIFFLILSTTHLPCALNADTILHEDHNHPRIPNLHEDQHAFLPWELALEEHTYVPKFAGLDRSILGRAPAQLRTLTKETPAQGNLDIEDGGPQSWILASPLDSRNLGEGDAQEKHGQHGLLKRQGAVNSVYITLCICDQPSRKTPNRDVPPLKLKVSDSPNPSNDSNAKSSMTDLGLGTVEYTPSENVYITVSVEKNTDFKGIYNYTLMASDKAFYTSYDNSDTNNLAFLDSDSNSALLVSPNLTVDANQSSATWQQWMNNTPPYSIFVYHEDDSAIKGIQKSTCALMNHAQFKGRWSGTNGSSTVSLSMTSSAGGQLRQHFYVSGLNAGTTYMAVMAFDGNSTANVGGAVGHGPTVWKNQTFKTKTDKNCAVIYDLPFCTDTAYAVPYNPSLQTNLTELGLQYNKQAFDLYQNFFFSRQQIPCNTTSSAQYSLARNCTDCDAAYKDWLCAVTIPRCQDYSNQEYSWLQERSVNQSFWHSNSSFLPASNETGLNKANRNSGRTPFIQNEIRPGPWREVKPCSDLCYRLVQSCPAALQFECPVGEWLNASYGDRKNATPGSNVTCNDPTRAWGTSAAGMARVRMNLLRALVLLTLVLVVY